MCQVPRLIRSGRGERPKLVLVDDHPRVLARVSAFVSDAFDVVGVATDGYQAIDVVRDAAPDAVVMDINMPGLDGFRTLERLEQAGSRAPVVFLSAHSTQELVDEAFRCGGRGYVVKHTASSNLVSAIDQVLLGRLFVPTLPSLFPIVGRSGHVMQVHTDVASMAGPLVDFFDVALRQGDAVCVIGTSEIRAAVTPRLQARGWGVSDAPGSAPCLVLDVADAVNRFLRNGLPDPRIVAEIAAELDAFRRSVTDGDTSRLIVFGNIAASLSAAGNLTAAMALEHQWNAVTRNLPFLTVCGYPTDCFHEGVVDFWATTCAEHSAVNHASRV